MALTEKQVRAMDIKEVVDDPKWQMVRRDLKGIWSMDPNQGLRVLDRYLGNWSDSRKLRQVHNYLGALRGIDYRPIKEMREKVKARREELLLREQ